jgi:hypothetical protein
MLFQKPRPLSAAGLDAFPKTKTVVSTRFGCFPKNQGRCLQPVGFQPIGMTRTTALTPQGSERLRKTEALTLQGSETLQSSCFLYAAPAPSQQATDTASAPLLLLCSRFGCLPRNQEPEPLFRPGLDAFMGTRDFVSSRLACSPKSQNRCLQPVPMLPQEPEPLSPASLDAFPRSETVVSSQF